MQNTNQIHPVFAMTIAELVEHGLAPRVANELVRLVHTQRELRPHIDTTGAARRAMWTETTFGQVAATSTYSEVLQYSCRDRLTCSLSLARTLKGLGLTKREWIHLPASTLSGLSKDGWLDLPVLFLDVLSGSARLLLANNLSDHERAVRSEHPYDVTIRMLLAQEPAWESSRQWLFRHRESMWKA